MHLSPAPARWRRFTIGRLMLAVAILAVGLKLYLSIGAGAGNVLVALVLSLLAARTILANPPGSPPRRRAAAWATACLALYLPCGLGFLMDCSHCVGTWRQVWPLVPGSLPGFFASRLLIRDGRWEVLEWALSAGFTLAAIALVASLGLRGRWWMAAGLTVAAVYSTVVTHMVSSALRS